jgi:hypothetical protein
MEAYDSSGLSRKLTGQDVSALESQAGFPADRGAATVSISESQWREFEAQYHATLKLLQQISSVGFGLGFGGFGVLEGERAPGFFFGPGPGSRVCRPMLTPAGCVTLKTPALGCSPPHPGPSLAAPLHTGSSPSPHSQANPAPKQPLVQTPTPPTPKVWNLEDPCVIAGFDMDRQGTVQALRSEPAGTFICRFSMSQPGCLVLTCKAPGHPNADGDGLVHAIIRIEDLLERRVDTWIRDFPGATHVLDVYKGKRVDKRKARRGARARGRGDATGGPGCGAAAASEGPAQRRGLSARARARVRER